MSAEPAAQTRDQATAPASGVAHVAIIMDGNGRWAAQRGLPRAKGHRAGVEAARRALQAAADLGVPMLTLYSFSTENWRRPAGEIQDLLGILREFITSDLPKLKEEGVRVRVIGDRDSLDRELKLLVARAESETAQNAKFALNIAFNYGGRDEIVRAARALARAAKAGGVDPASIDEETFSRFLDTSGLPDPDLVIRTSGEKRVSNFLIWQAAYSEYVFPDVFWPDFDRQHLQDALDEFMRRERRYGGSAQDARP